MATSILLVCTANICRSPMAEALLRARLPSSVALQSRGTHAASRGEPIDARAAAALARRQLRMPWRWRSRRVELKDLERHELVLAMDHDNLRALRALAPAELQPRLQLFLDLVPGRAGTEVPDPFFGPAQGFEQVLQLLDEGALALERRLHG